MNDSNIDIFINATDRASPAAKSAQSSLDAFNKSAKEGSGVLGNFTETGNQLWGILGGAATAVLAGTTVAVGALAFAFKDSVGEARESINAQKQLSAVIESTGGAAGVTAQQANDLAGSFAKVTNFGDDTILSGENMLLTFTNIGSNVFPRATETMLNMSQALGQDLKGSAIQLGKALNDPIAGVSALQRVGVTFTDGQKEMIKSMVEAGDVAGAQGLILDELAKEFGGSAKAMADPAIMLKNQWLEVEESAGKFLIPVLNQLSQQAMPYVTGAADALSKAVGTFNDYLDQGLPFLTSFNLAIAGIIPSEFRNIWTNFIAAIANGIEIFKNLFVQVERYEDEEPIIGWLLDLTDMARGAFGYFYDQTKRVVNLLLEWGGSVLPPLIEGMDKFFTSVSTIWDVLVKVTKPITDAIAKFIGFDDVMTGIGILLAGPVLLAIYGVVASLASFLAPIAGVIAAVALLRAAWENDFLGIRTFTLTTISKITDWFYNESGIWQGTWEKTLSKLGNTIEIFWERNVYFAIRSWLIKTRDDMTVHLHYFGTLWDGWVQATQETLSGWVGDAERIFTNWKDIAITTFHDWIDPVADAVGKWAIGVKQMFEEWVGWLVGDFGILTKWKNAAVKLFEEVLAWWDTNIQPWVDKGKAIIQGFWDGTVEVWKHFTDWAGTTFQGWVDWFDNLFQFGSPSRLFNQRGQWLMEGFADGIKAYSQVPISYVESMTNSLTAQMDRLKGAVIQNVFDINNAANQLHIDPKLLPASMGGTGNVVGIAPGGGLILGGITNLPNSYGLPGPAAPVVPTTTIGGAVGGGINVGGTSQGLLGGITLSSATLENQAIKTSADEMLDAMTKWRDFTLSEKDPLNDWLSHIKELAPSMSTDVQSNLSKWLGFWKEEGDPLNDYFANAMDAVRASAGKGGETLGVQDATKAAADKIKNFIAGIGDFLSQTVNTSTVSKVFQDAFSSKVGAPGQGYTELQGAQDKIRKQMADLLGLPQIFGTLDAKGNLDALTKALGSGTDLNKVAGLLQSAVDFRTLANYYDKTDQYGNVLPTDPRLTGQPNATTNTYNITLQGSNNANADILGLVQMLGSLQGSVAP